MLLARLAILLCCLLPSLGCAHKVLIETDPPGARVLIDGALVGDGPVEVERRAWLGDQLNVTVEADNHQTAEVVVQQTDWFLWPGIIALTPLLGLSVVWIPFAGPVLTVIWAVATSPTLIALTFIRRYPEHVRVKLKPRVTPEGFVLPSDIFLVPDDYSPNPPPAADIDVDEPESGPTESPQPPGANPVP